VAQGARGSFSLCAHDSGYYSPAVGYSKDRKGRRTLVCASCGLFLFLEVLMNATSLLERKNAIPDLISIAVDEGNVSEIVKLKKESGELDLQILAERMAKCRSEIESKEKEQIQVQLELDSLEQQTVAAREVYEEALKAADDALTAHQKLQFMAGSCDQKLILLFEDLQELKRKLEGMKLRITGDKLNG
jgi:chromosome segregation ATPase